MKEGFIKDTSELILKEAQTIHVYIYSKTEYFSRLNSDVTPIVLGTQVASCE